MANEGLRTDYMEVSERLLAEKYPDATCAFVAGSIVRGQASPTSDIDLVVVYESLSHAYRDSYYYDDWPVEAYVHDLETLAYFMDEFDAKEGHCGMHTMLLEGIVIPENSDFSERIKVMAQQKRDIGPAPLAQDDINMRKYFLTDTMDDIIGYKNKAELMGSLSQLFQLLADFYLRFHGKWSAKGKWIPRRLQEEFPTLHETYMQTFDGAFSHGNLDKLRALFDQIMDETGGKYWEGLRLDAPEDWRKKD